MREWVRARWPVADSFLYSVPAEALKNTAVRSHDQALKDELLRVAGGGGGGGGKQQDVARHYDERQQQRNKGVGLSSDIHFVRKVNNYAKAVAIDSWCIRRHFESGSSSGSWDLFLFPSTADKAKAQFAEFEVRSVVSARDERAACPGQLLQSRGKGKGKGNKRGKRDGRGGGGRRIHNGKGRDYIQTFV